jgi:hypothetical protein
MSRAVAAVLLAAALLGGRVAAAQPSDPPDPRRGERLDGRTVPRDPFRVPRAIGRGALAVPRFLIDVVLWPVVRVAAFAERHHVVDRVYWAFTSDDRLVGVRPDFRYETGLRASVGLRFFDRRALGRGSLLELRGRSGGRDYVRGEVRVRAPHDTPLTFELRAIFFRNENQLFAGIDALRRSELREAGRDTARYGVDAGRSALLVGWSNDWLDLLGAAEIDLRTYRSSDDLERFYCAAPGTPECVTFDDALVPGFREGLRVARLTANALLDTRRGRRGLAGVRLELDGAIAGGFLGDPSRHARLVADARLVLDLHDRALILRLNGGVVARLGDAPIPFEELLSPTGTDGLRGMSYGRLRGESQLFGVLEYRWLVAPYVDAALFVEDGGAFGPGFEGLSLSRMIPGYGFGLRIHQIRGDYWNAASLVWMQIGHSPGEGARFMIGLGSEK